MASRGTRRFAAVALYLAALLLLAHLGYGVFRHALDPDEFQFLHGGWLVAEGRLPYVDFWDDHGPLPHLLCSFFYRAGGRSDAAALLLHRSAVFALLLVSAALLHATARRLRPGDELLPAAALALYAASPILSHKGIEVRSDNLLQPIWALALLLFVRAAQSGRDRAFLPAGAALGAGFLVTPKTALLGLASGGMLLTWMVFRRRFEARAVAWFAFGSALFPALLGLWQWSEGALAALLHTYFVDALSAPRFGSAHGLGTIEREAPLWALLGVAACAVLLIAAARRRLPALVACIGVCAAALVAQYVYLLPIRFLHSLIPAVVPMALLTAWAAQELLVGGPSRGAPRRAEALRVAALVGLVLAVGLREASLRRYDGRALRSQLERAERVARLVPRGAYLFDGGWPPVPFPRPLPDASLVIRIQQRIFAGAYPVDLVEELDRRDVAWWQIDPRMPRFDRLLKEFREQEFLPLADALWVAGRRLAPDAAGGASFSLRIAGAYWWAGPASLRVDGRPATNPAVLGDGPHRAEWSGAGSLLLAQAPPEHWPPGWGRPFGARANPLPEGR
jgi:Dolichyl-phosphate-mannose-protein mannosyltransferase